MRSAWLWLMLVVLALVPLVAPAQVARIEPPTIRAGERFQFIVEASGEFPQPNQPTRFSDNVSLVSGVASSALSQSWINGRMRSSFSYSWTFTALAEGDFSIGPMQVTLDGKTVEVPPVRGRIGGELFPPMPVPEGLPGVASPAYVHDAKNPALDRRLQGRVFLVTPTPPAAVYPGQPLPLQTWLYIDAQFLSNVRQVRALKPAEGTPFLTIPDLTVNQNWNQEMIQLGDRRFARSPVQVTTLAAHSAGAGKLTVPEVEIDLLLPTGRGRQDPFFGVVSGEQYVARFRSAEIPIEVKPLPTPPADAMAQVVGNYTLSAAVDRTEVNQGDLVSYTVGLSGRGYLGGFGLANLKDLPGLTFIDDEPKSSIRFINGAYVASGQYQFTFQVRDAGRIEIPGLKIAQFDPETATETLLTTPPIVLQAAATATAAMTLGGASVNPASAAAERGQARDLGGDGVLHIDASPWRPAPTRPAPSVLRLPVFWAAHGAALLLGLALVGLNQWRLRAESDPARVRLRGRQRAVSEALTQAQSLAAAGASADFHAALGRALVLAAAARLDRPAEGLTLDDAAHALESHGVSRDLAVRWRQFAEQCEERRYAPDAAAADSRAADLDTARNLVAQLRGSDRP